MSAEPRDSDARLQWGLFISLLAHLLVLGGMAVSSGEGRQGRALALEVILPDRAGAGTRSPELQVTAAAEAVLSIPASSPSASLRQFSETPAPAADGLAAGESGGVGMPDGEVVAADSEGDDAQSDPPPTIFLPSKSLDRSPTPISAPDPRKYLTGVDFPTSSFRLRLYIDAQGAVVNIETNGEATPLDDQQMEKVKEMFYATAFIPGNLQGRDVASYVDVIVDLADAVS